MRKNYLDAVRAFAAALVVMVHSQQHFPAPNRALELVSAFGQFGVQLFFVLSAFLIFESLDRLKASGGTIATFFIHRFLRIAPLYYAAILMFLCTFGLLFPTLGISLSAPSSFTVVNVLANVFFVHGLVPSANNAIVGGGWSIGTEMLFYALAPVLFSLRKHKAALLLIIAGCYILVLKLVELDSPTLSAGLFLSDNSFLYFSIANQLPVFICGALLFSTRGRAFKISAPIAAAGFVAAMTACAYLFIANFTGRMTFFFVPLLAGVASSFLIVLASKFNVSSRVVTEFGRRSFSVYVFNMPALLIVNMTASHFSVKLPFFVGFPIVLILVYLFSGVTYRFIEKPFIEIAKKMAQTKAESPGAIPTKPYGKRAIETELL